MQEDLNKAPGDRKRGVIGFLEGYELLSERDLEEFVDNQGESRVECAVANPKESVEVDTQVMGQTSPKKNGSIHRKQYLLAGSVGIQEENGVIQIREESSDKRHEIEVVSSEEEAYI